MRCVILTFLMSGTSVAWAEDWPQFRGPSGQGLCKGGLPTEWSPTKNIAWKKVIPGAGWSSPIIVGGRVYLTCAVTTGNDLSLRALCLDAKSGDEIWNKEIFLLEAKRGVRMHPKNSNASPTPVIDGNRLYTHFGHLGSAALDLDGSIIWTNTDLVYNPVHGNGGTPVLTKKAFIFSSDGGDKQFVAALNRDTGKLLWKTDRKTTSSKKFAFCTPIVITVAGKEQIVSPAAGMVAAYDPDTGAEIWRFGYGEGYSVVPRPAFGHGLVFLSSGFDSPVIYAIRPDGKGDVTKTHLAWKLAKAAPLTPSPLLVGNELYLISDGGVASCVDAKTGKVHWSERIGGAHSASPIAADGKIYFLSEAGLGVVVKADVRFARLADNDLKEKSLASYGAADGVLFIRTNEHLYCIQSP